MKIEYIIEKLKEIRHNSDLEVSDEVLFEQAIDIYLSNKISKDKKENIKSINESKGFKSFNKVISNSPTEKQIDFLKRNKIYDKHLNKQTAKEVISNYIKKNQLKQPARDKQDDY